jgi:hypothetical protein
MAPYTRPGVEASVRLSKLVHKKHENIWSTIEAKYNNMLVAKKKGSNELLELDKECEEIGRKWKSMVSEKEEESDCGAIMTFEQLCQVMKWKFSKGKARPLWKHINANSEESVEQYSKTAFSKVFENDDESSITAAINELSNLKGVGPAGASAILSLFRPDLFVFMDDEVIECLYEGKRDYTLKVYTLINNKCKDIASQLGDGWNSRRVGRALWTAAIVSAYCDEKDLTLEYDSSANHSNDDLSETNPATKKQRIS